MPQALTEGLHSGRQIAAPTVDQTSKYILFLRGHALGLTPPGVEFYIFAVHLDGLIGAHAHIILLLGGQLAHGLRSGLIFAYCHGLIALFEVRRCAILHFIAFSLGTSGASLAAISSKVMVFVPSL